MDLQGTGLETLAARVQRVLKRRGLAPGDADLCRADPAVEELSVLSNAPIADTNFLHPDVELEIP